MKNNKKYVGSSPMKYVWIPAAITAAAGVYNAVAGGVAKKRARRAQAQAEAAAAPYLEAYKSYEYKNPYEGMENVYEDMRVNTQAAEFQREQLAQQQADVLQGLRGAAGGSGVAALAQSMARAGAVQAQKISADISRQETAREQAQLAEQSRIQGLQMYGDQLVDQQEMQRNMNLYNIETGKAGIAAQQFAAGQQQMMGGIGQVASAGLQAYSAGMFDGAPSTSNLTMAPGSTLPGNTLDSSYMSPTYGSNPTFTNNFGPQDYTAPIYGGTEVNVSGYPSYSNQSDQFSYESVYGNTPTYTLNSPFDKKKK